MYLKRITIAGFKSFAGKAVLDLEPGITAVVGPNGSGKSNLADAVRWALGEQNKSRLRLGDREEVVFAGTDRRPRASFAEVTLLFDNQDGAFPLELTEVEISRRLYRSGETDYRLGGRSVRLADIHQLLAEAGFGAGSYAVIGQGMIDNFLLSNPSERKLLFDEAAGIRGSELKREAALRKLTATAQNLTRLRDIQSELEPRLASLERTLAAAAEEQALTDRLAALRQELTAVQAAALGQQQQDLMREQSQLTLQLHRLRHTCRNLQREQTAHLRAAEHSEALRAKHQAEIHQTEAEYERLLTLLTRQQAELTAQEVAAKRLTELSQRRKRLAAELAAADAAVGETVEELAQHQSAGERAAKALERTATEVSHAQTSLLEVRAELGDGTQQQYISHALSLLKTLARQLAADPLPLEQARLLVHKTGRLLSHATRADEAEFLARIQAAQAKLEAAMTRRETVAEHQSNIMITQRSLELELVHRRAAVERLEAESQTVKTEYDKLRQTQDSLASARQECTATEHKLADLKIHLAGLRTASDAGHTVTATNLADNAAMLQRLEHELAAVQARLAAIAAERRAVRQAAQALQQQIKTWNVRRISHSAPAQASSAAGLEREMTRVEAQLAAHQTLQGANITEYEEVSSRALELRTQITDLEQAEADLRQVVTQLDGLIQERFKANFATLSEHFSRYFARLFGGGTAQLELVEQEAGEYGILIKVSPKGKRLANLTALSGGERAMAGVALLAAILNVNPSPFVVLDEIDAALDEANSGRLADILQELAEKSQLIVITHNRQTMRSARVLFGVTMNEHHVSHLLSLRLEEATQMAAR